MRVDAAFTLALYSVATSGAGWSSLVTLIAQDGIFLIPAVLAILWLSARPHTERRVAVLAGVIAAALALAIGLTLERTLARPRPFVELGIAPLLAHRPDSSFPSDHTLVGVALAGALLWRSRGAGVALVLWALIVGLARVASGLHYPSDILGSAILALLLDAAAWWIVPRLVTALPFARGPLGLVAREQREETPA